MISDQPAFCVIAPTAYLEDYATQSHSHLVLAHIVDTNPTYCEFYKSMANRGDRIIMDCSTFELGESYDPDELVRLGDMCGADTLVLPDYPGKHSSVTITAAKKLIPVFKGEGFSTFFVPQSEMGDIADWIYSYQWAADQEDIDVIGMSILGIPNALPHIPKSYARVVMTELLIDRGMFNLDKHHHYLGLNAGPNVELPSLLMMNALTTCDSSNPVWAGLHGYRYDTMSTDCLPVHKKFLREVDFDYEYVKKSHIHETVQYNLQTIFDIFNNPEKYI